MLQDNWETIRDEGTALLDKKGLFQIEDEDLTDSGSWKQYTLFAQG